MLFNQSIQIRLSDAQYQRYTAGARQAGVSLSCYLRGQLEQQAVVQAELYYQRQLLEDLTALAATQPAAAPAALPPGLHALWIELLLLSRLQAGPEKVLRAARDLERWGLPLWTNPEAVDADRG